MSLPLSLFWHRQDLRIDDNLGLYKAFEQSQKIISVFCLDQRILERDDIAPIRIKYLIHSLKELKKEYQQKNGYLLIVNDKPEKILLEICKIAYIKKVFWNLDVEPYSTFRDNLVQKSLEKNNISYQTFWDQLVVPPDKIKTQNQLPYTIFTPFSKNWLKQADFWLQKNQTQKIVKFIKLELELIFKLKKLEFNLDDLENSLLTDLPDIKPFIANKNSILDFINYKITKYKIDRDYPYLDATSKFSTALKFGTISTRNILNCLKNNLFKQKNELKIETPTFLFEIKKSKDEIQTSWLDFLDSGSLSFVLELVWREFYQQAMFHFPYLEKEPYNKLFKNFNWDNDEQKFELWKEGKTGYPIVDSAMRQLNTTGWMHNRLRMIVASFLVKDLHINWQWGEKYFMQKLIDGNLPSNNGGWQWSASCGLDPKPLRIFNPNLQASRYDSQAKFIKKWLPELQNLEIKEILNNEISNENRKKYGYFDKIVDHKQESMRFKQKYQEVKSINF